MRRSSPPYRADHVGSLLRPPELLAARRRRDRGELSDAGLREVEDRLIREVVRLQEDAGLESITDGEYRRFIFHIDFLSKLSGIEERGGIATKFHTKDGVVDYAPPRLVVTGKLGHPEGIQRRDFEFLRSVTRRTPKVTIPSPTMVHFRGGRAGIDERAYPDLEEFFGDLARCYREEIADLYAAGCRYLQLDDTNLAYLCDPEQRAAARRRGDDPNELPRTYARLINAAIDRRPADMTVCVHLCRGNFRSAWIAEGGYEPVAEVLFNDLAVDGFFLEYDDERSGDFAPLRFVPKGKTVVLGLVTTKVPALESKDKLKRRIDEASRSVDLDQLCLSPQCGFASSLYGNQLGVEDEVAKLALVVETAREVWGS
jgi:5-methyltetrahydropteroyltriglutamate--homocysteine methyltransferase